MGERILLSHSVLSCKAMKKLLIIVFLFLFVGCAGLSDKVITERMDKLENESIQRDTYLMNYLLELTKYYNDFVATYNKHLEDYHGYKPTKWRD